MSSQRPERAKRFRAWLLLVLAVLTRVIHRSLPTQGAPGRVMSLPRASARGQAPQSAKAGGAEAPRTIETGPYIRSNADGIVEDNLSYRGPAAETSTEPDEGHDG